MRHGKKVAKLGRTASHRKAMLSNMMTSLFANETITTTQIRAKELKRSAEKMITFAKRGDLHARRQVLRVIADKQVVAKLFDEIG
ncbi:50S ribosomal protein L17, partial [bacterium]|nr:50S ribosomal protein L17 [bacterium]